MLKKNKNELFINLFIIILYLSLPFLFFTNVSCIDKAIFGHGDSLALTFPLKTFLINNLNQGNFPLWNPYNFNGFPFLADIQTSSLYIINIIIGLVFKNPFLSYNLSIFLHFSLAGIFTYLYTKELNISKIAAFSSGLMFMFSGFMIVRIVHPQMIFTFIWLPLILYLIEKFIKSRSIKFIFLASIIMAMQFFAGFPQIFVYCVLIEILYGIFIFFRNDENKSIKNRLYLFKIFFIFVIGFLLMLVQFLPTYTLMQLGFRVKLDFQDFSNFSLDIKKIPLLFFPYLFGKMNTYQLKDVQNIFIGNNNETFIYLGTFTFFLSILGFFHKNKTRIFWIIIAFISLILVFGKNTPLYQLLYHVPIYNKFRIPSRNWVEFCFAFSILGGFGFDYIINSKYKEFKKRIYVILSVISSFLVGFFILYYFFKKAIKLNKATFLGNNINFLSQSFALNKSSTYIPLILILLSLIIFIILIFLKKKEFFKKTYILIFLIIFIFFDLYSFGHNYEPFLIRDFKPLLNEQYYYDTYKYLKSDNSIFRVYPYFTNLCPYDSDLKVKDIAGNLNLLYGLQSIAGYQVLFLKDYNKVTRLSMIGAHADNNYSLIDNNNVLAVSNTKYVIIAKDYIETAGIGNLINKLGYKDTNNLINYNIIKNNKNENNGTEFNDKNNSIIFRSKSNDLKILSTPINLKNSTFYTIKFNVKINGIRDNLNNDTDPNLHIDFYGVKNGKDTYDNAGQEIILPVSEFLENNFKGFTFYINSSDISEGTKTYFRLFYTTNLNLEIKDLNVFEYSVTKDSKYKILDSVKDSILIQNNNYLPRFYLASNVINVSSIDQVEKNLWDKNYNPKINTMVENYDGKQSSFNLEDSKLDILKYENNYVDLKINLKNDGFLVFSDTYYPGWRAYIDGKPTKIYKTNGLFKGIYIPAGEHKIRFRFLPNDFIIGAVISGITFVALIVFLCIPNKKKKELAKHLRDKN